MWEIPDTCSISWVTVQPSNPYDMGFAIGRKFASMIQSRLRRDPHLQSALLPFSGSSEGQELVSKLFDTNRMQYPRYWEELRGTADGSGVPFFEVLLLNLRKEIAPFLPDAAARLEVGKSDQCSDVLLCTNSEAFVAHNEDADISVKDHVYLVHATLESGLSFIACTYAGDLPSCAFGFNDAGVGFTLNAVPLAPEEAVAGGIGRNFISRDLLEAASLEDALRKIKQSRLAAGHNYNVLDMNSRRIVSVETASKSRFSQLEIGSAPFFHANMYRHLHVPQVVHESSVHRETQAAQLPMSTEAQALALLGDTSDSEFPVYMQGPQLCTLCSVVFDIICKKVTIYRGNPKEMQKDVVLYMTDK